MSRRRAIATVLGATVLGLVVGAAFSGDAVVALDVWIGASAVSVSLVAVRELLRASAIETAKLAPAWRFPPRDRGAPEPAGVQRIQTLIAASDSNPRFYGRRLRPELIALSEHFLPRRHGFGLEDETRLIQLFGDLAWLVDPSVAGRAPELIEVERFVDILVGESRASVFT